MEKAWGLVEHIPLSHSPHVLLCVIAFETRQQCHSFHIHRESTRRCNSKCHQFNVKTPPMPDNSCQIPAKSMPAGMNP